jgi:Cytochrome c oxidase biogenesis protein Cmc1 like
MAPPSSADTEPVSSEAEVRARSKETAREGRLSFKNRAQDLLKYELKEDAKEKCKDYIKTFAECAKKEGLLVVFQCRSQLKEMNGCMAIHNGPEAWQRYKEEHKEELELRAQGKKVY